MVLKLSSKDKNLSPLLNYVRENNRYFKDLIVPANNHHAVIEKSILVLGDENRLIIDKESYDLLEHDLKRKVDDIWL